jgi:hypothetical protein
MISELKINLPVIKLGNLRGYNYCGPVRERITSEKYFRQVIQVFNKEGNLVDSGFVQINNYTDMCRMVRVCNKSSKIFHLCEKWQHSGSEFYKTDYFSIIDLVTGNHIGEITDETVSNFVELRNASSLESCCLVGDLEKDEYSKVLLECLDEYSKSNAPPQIEKKSRCLKEVCDCNLFEHLEINELFRNDEIDEETKSNLQNSLTCECEDEPSALVLTEEQQSARAALKLKAQAEIAEVFTKKEI